MRELTLETISVFEALRTALSSSDLLVDDLEGSDSSYFALLDADGRVVGHSGIEHCDENAALLRSVLVVPAFRSQGYRRQLVELTIARTSPSTDVYLVTTNAAYFFESIDFARVQRDEARRQSFRPASSRGSARRRRRS